jgi:hypothetical protein
METQISGEICNFARGITPGCARLERISLEKRLRQAAEK